MIEIICKQCKKEFWVKPCRKTIAKFCSYKCKGISQKGKHNSTATEFKKGQFSGKTHPYWQGGITYSYGYKYIYKLNHPFCNNHGYVKNSRLVMEKYLGRYLVPKEIVHHKGIKYPISSIKNKQDDRTENLQLFKNTGAHSSFHYKLRRKKKGVLCSG